MKRILGLLLASIMILSFSACGKNEDKEPKDTKKEEVSQTQSKEETKKQEDVTKASLPEDFDFAQIMAGNGATDKIWGKEDELTKQKIIAEGKADGVDVSFGSDGSMTVVDPENGDTIVQNPNGTWNIVSEDGTVGQYGGSWPENEFTKLLPKPKMELLAANTSETGFTVGFENATIDEVMAYAEDVKAAGFTVDAQTENQTVGDIVIYSYTAKNADGYMVTVSFAMGTSAVLLEKP